MRRESEKLGEHDPAAKPLCYKAIRAHLRAKGVRYMTVDEKLFKYLSEGRLP